MRFYLGTHKPQHLERTAVPLFLSRRQLDVRVRLPVALGPWALDSGGFTELTRHGAWQLDAAGYARVVRRFADEVGRLEWAASRDYLAVPDVLAAIGLDVPAAQAATVRNYLEDREELGELVRPVLQGWTVDDYRRHADAYATAGVDLTRGVTLLGSIAARNDDDGVELVVRELAEAGVRLHGLGVKDRGLARYGDALESADSLAWSREARRRPPLPVCSHPSCQNCLSYALVWRERQLRELDGGAGRQLALM